MSTTILLQKTFLMHNNNKKNYNIESRRMEKIFIMQAYHIILYAQFLYIFRSNNA